MFQSVGNKQEIKRSEILMQRKIRKLIIKRTLLILILPLRKKCYISIAEKKWLMLLREILPLYSENHMKLTNTFLSENA
jgi:hypothetical protein